MEIDKMRKKYCKTRAVACSNCCYNLEKDGCLFKGYPIDGEELNAADRKMKKEMGWE